MSEYEIIAETKRRLVSIVRCISIKRAIASENPEPHLSFWRVIMGAMLDVAIIDWCTIFGVDNSEAHWKKLIIKAEHDKFREALFTKLNTSKADWDTYYNQMTQYRNNHFAHMGKGRATGDIYPDLELALASAKYYYGWLFNSGAFPDSSPSLEDYADVFFEQSSRVARAALSATDRIPELVR